MSLPQWISVNEKLPPESEKVLVCRRYTRKRDGKLLYTSRSICISHTSIVKEDEYQFKGAKPTTDIPEGTLIFREYYEKYPNGTIEEDEVTHWMVTPPLPKEDKDE